MSDVSQQRTGGEGACRHWWHCGCFGQVLHSPRVLAPRQMVLKIGFACGGDPTGWAEELHRQAGCAHLSSHQYGKAAQHSTAQHSMAQHSTARHSIVQWLCSLGLPVACCDSSLKRTVSAFTSLHQVPVVDVETVLLKLTTHRAIASASTAQCPQNTTLHGHRNYRATDSVVDSTQASVVSLLTLHYR